MADRGRVNPVLVLFAGDSAALAAAAMGAAIVAAAAPPTFARALWIFGTVAFVNGAMSFSRVYRRDRARTSSSSLAHVGTFVNALSVTAVLELGALELLGGSALDVGRGTVLLFAAFAVALLVSVRVLLGARVNTSNAAERTVIMGAGRVGRELAERLAQTNGHRLRIVGFLDGDAYPSTHAMDGLPVLGAESDLASVVEKHGISRVIVAFSRRPVAHVLDVVREAGIADLNVSVVPRWFDLIDGRAEISEVAGIPLIEIPTVPLSAWARALKRTFDLVVTVSGLVVLAPLMLAIALAIKLDSPGPVFFRQPRVGRDGDVFEILKFRTMVAAAESMLDDLLPANEAKAPLFKIRADPRLTRVGRRLRKYCLDELPQLFNVVTGEMSLVGPRPFVIHEDARITGWARRRLDVAPGITGPWQVLGRNEISYDEMVKLDYLYAATWSLWRDVGLLLRTIPIVLGGHGY